MAESNSAFIVGMANQKGGVGKTTSCVSLAAIAANKNNKVLLIDLDPNAHATHMVSNKQKDFPYTSHDFLMGVDPRKCIIPTGKANLFLLPAKDILYKFEKKNSKDPLKNIILGKRLKHLMEVVKYDYIFLDCPSTVGAIQFNAITACDMVIIPAIPDFLSLSGFNNLLISLKQINEKLKKSCNYYLLFTMYQDQIKSQRSVIDWADTKIKDITFKHRIPFDENFMETTSRGSNIIDELPASEGSQSYNSIYVEIQKIAGKV